MQRMTAVRNDDFQASEVTPVFERRHFTHKRMERWIRLQQFVFGLPDDYSYAICTTAKKDGRFRSRSLVRVGWMTWFGDGHGADRQHSLAVSLLDTAEARSSNSSAVFWHSIRKWVMQGFGRRHRRGEVALTAPAVNSVEERQLELLAG